MQRFYKRKFSVPLTFDSKHEISLALHQCCCITFSSEVSILPGFVECEAFQSQITTAFIAAEAVKEARRRSWESLHLDSQLKALVYNENKKQ